MVNPWRVVPKMENFRNPRSILRKRLSFVSLSKFRLMIRFLSDLGTVSTCSDLFRLHRSIVNQDLLNKYGSPNSTEISLKILNLFYKYHGEIVNLVLRSIHYKDYCFFASYCLNNNNKDNNNTNNIFC